MHSARTSAIILVASVLLGISCTDPHEECDLGEFEKCHTDQALDSSQMVQAFIGKWRWEYLLSCSSPKDAKNSDNYAGTAIEFFADGNFTLHRPNSTSHFQWRLDSIPYDGWRIVDPTRTPMPPHASLYGRILICGDRLLANNGYVDGADNFFMKE
jgi:hypothetical protein